MADTTLTVIFKGRDQSASSTASSVSRAFSNLGGVVKAGALAGVAGLATLGVGIVGLGSKLVGLGSDAQEMIGKFNVVFANTGEQVTEQLDAFAESVGRSRFELMGMASTFGDTLKPMGFTEEAAADMSVELTQLATDLSSFNNMSMDEALQRLQGTLIGSHENALAFGVIINENTLAAELARNGWDNLTGSALEQAKVQARINLLIAGTTDAQGDAARTSGSWANQMRALKGRLTDVGTEIGLKLLPVVTPFLNKIGQLAGELGNKVIGFFEKIQVPLSFFSDALEDLLAGDFVGFFTNLQVAVFGLFQEFGASQSTLQGIRDFFGGILLDLQNGATPIEAFKNAILGLIPQEVIDKAIAIKDAIIDFVTPIVNFVDEHSETIKNTFIAIGAALATAAIAGKIAAIATAIGTLVTGFQAAVAASGLFSAGLAAIGGPITLIIGAVALLAIAWNENWGDIQGKTAEVLLWFNAEVLPTWKGNADNMRAIWDIASTRISELWKNLQLTIDVFVQWWDVNVVQVWEGNVDNMSVAWGIAKENIAELWNGLQLTIESFINWWGTNVVTVWAGNVSNMASAWETAKGNLTGAWNSFKETVEAAWGAIQPIFEAIEAFAAWVNSTTLSLDIQIPELPDWATPDSPLPIHTAWKNFGEYLGGQNFVPKVDMSQAQPLLAPVSGASTSNSTVINDSRQTVFNVNTPQFNAGQENRIQIAIKGGI